MTNDEHWIETLEVFEAGLRHHALTLVDGDHATTNPWPPATLPSGPVPSHLRQRAAVLLGQSISLSDAVADELEQLDQRRKLHQAARATADHPRISMSL